MSKRKTMDKAQARERRNQLLESAAAAELSLIEGVRGMRAIAGMTQEEFAAHRGVSARVIKAIELGQGNPTAGTLNRIGEFFGLEVGFIPARRKVSTGADTAMPEPKTSAASARGDQAVIMDRASLENAIRMRLEEVIQLALDEAGARFLPDLLPGDAPVVSNVRVSTRKTKKPTTK